MHFAIRAGTTEGNQTTWGDPFIPEFKAVNLHGYPDEYTKIASGVYVFATITSQVVETLTIDVEKEPGIRTKLGYWNGKDLPAYVKANDTLLELTWIE